MLRGVRPAVVAEKFPTWQTPVASVEALISSGEKKKSLACA